MLSGPVSEPHVHGKCRRSCRLAPGDVGQTAPLAGMADRVGSGNRLDPGGRTVHFQDAAICLDDGRAAARRAAVIRMGVVCSRLRWHEKLGVAAAGVLCPVVATAMSVPEPALRTTPPRRQECLGGGATCGANQFPADVELPLPSCGSRERDGVIALGPVRSGSGYPAGLSAACAREYRERLNPVLEFVRSSRWYSKYAKPNDTNTELVMIIKQ